tara:strand:- start:1091 stop:2608 length:1518 start_codon:yes stop_codon:yes gene_type:complete
LATPPKGTKLSLGKLGRATAVGNSDYTSKTSLNDAARDSGTDKTSISDFYVGAVDATIDGYPYVDEQTNETYEITFTNNNSLFDSRIKTRYQNFTWTTADSDLFALQSNQDSTAQYNAGTISDSGTAASKSFKENLVTDGHFSNWDDANSLTSWYESGGSVVSRHTLASQSPSGSGDFAVKFNTQGQYISQSFTVDGNSIYEIRAHASSSNVGEGTIDMEVSGAYFQKTYRSIAGNTSWTTTRDDFATSGSVGVTQNLKLTFTAVSASTDHKPLLDSIFFRKWEGSGFHDTEVVITGKYHDDGQSDGFNDHATRYNTAISKTVEIQDTYGGLSIACFLPGTLITMSDLTTKPIEEINVGDEVLSLNLPGLPDEDLGYLEWKRFTMRPMDLEDLSGLVRRNKDVAKVENLFFDYMDGYYSINSGYLNVTGEHDLFTYTGSQWEWVTASNLKVGMKLLGFNGDLTTIDSVDYKDGEIEVINFDVEPLDIYYAGGILVHNKGTDSDPG